MPSLFVVPGGVSSQLQHFGRKVFHHGGEVDRRAGTDAFRIIAFPEEPMDPSDRELQPCPATAGLRLPLGLAWKRTSAVERRRRRRFAEKRDFLSLTAFAASRHVSARNVLLLLGSPCVRERGCVLPQTTVTIHQYRALKAE